MNEVGDQGGAPASAAAQEAEHEGLVRRNRELSVLNTIAQELNRSVDLGEALRNALALVADLLGLRTGWVWLVDEETAEPEVVAAQHLPPVLREEPSRMTSMCWCLRSFLRGDLEGAANVNVVECSRLSDLEEGTEGLYWHASVPIYAGERHLGVMNVATEDWRELSADELQLLYTIGYQIGIAVERARLHARAAQMATAEERLRLSRELHDSVAQQITAIGLQLEAADAVLERQPARAQEKVREALQLTREALNETRRVVQNLRAGALESRPLPQALRELGDRFTRTYGLRTSVSCTGSAARLSPLLESSLFRIAQEALNNTVKHARARRAWVELDIGDDAVVLSVRDDGRGFDPELAPGGSRSEHLAREGYGLWGIFERARLHNGALHVQTAPGQGTRIAVSMPLDGGLPWPRRRSGS